MRIDSGKTAKRMGVTKPADARKFDANGVVHAKPLVVKRKLFGYSYYYSFWGRRWSKQSVWFKRQQHVTNRWNTLESEWHRVNIIVTLRS